MTFGEKLQKLRKSKGWTQEDLAAQISISRQALSKWEQGAVVPDTENVLQISKIFGVSTDYLLNDDYESDGDIPAVHASAEFLEKNYKSKTRTIIGMCISCLGVVAFVVLYIVGMYSSVTYPASGGTNDVVSGFGVFISANRLEWIVGLCVLTVIAGAGIALSALFQKKKQKNG